MYVDRIHRKISTFFLRCVEVLRSKCTGGSWEVSQGAFVLDDLCPGFDLRLWACLQPLSIDTVGTYIRYMNFMYVSYMSVYTYEICMIIG